MFNVCLHRVYYDLMSLRFFIIRNVVRLCCVSTAVVIHWYTLFTHGMTVYGDFCNGHQQVF